jgi:hypothetical protein
MGDMFVLYFKKLKYFFVFSYYHSEYHPTFEFLNPSSLYAQFEMIPEEEALFSLATYTSHPNKVFQFIYLFIFMFFLCFSLIIFFF